MINTRPEAWRLLIGERQTVTNRDGAAGFVGPDYGGPYQNITRKWAIYFREEKAKRPINVKTSRQQQPLQMLETISTLMSF